jgi:acyl-CoA thioesterase FadM
VTAWIRLDYKAPTRADQFVVFNSKVDKIEGRKVFVSGQMEDLEGTVLVKAEYVRSSLWKESFNLYFPGHCLFSRSMHIC